MPIWHPTYTITPATATALMQIEADRTVVEQTPLPLAVQEELRRRARDLLLPKLISGEVDVNNLDIETVGRET
jgi:hypothetical protein